MKQTDLGWLRDRYTKALHDHLADRGETTLQHAYEIGRRTIDEGHGVLELLAVHQETLLAILAERKDDSRADLVGEAGRFLAECLSPFEMSQRGFQEAVAALRRQNDLLEEEARKIAHALHDDAGQLLVSVHLALQEASGGLSPRARLRLEKVRAPLDEIERQLRRLSHELRPTVLDDLGLIPALEFLAQGVGARNNVAIRVEGPRTPRLPSAIEIALYRIAQEALRNATKHARANRVDIRLAVETTRVNCSIRDDGRGFDLAAVMNRKGDRGLGLLGMRERLNAVGGQFNIESAPGRGTEIRIIVPLGGYDADTSSSRG